MKVNKICCLSLFLMLGYNLSFAQETNSKEVSSNTNKHKLLVGLAVDASAIGWLAKSITVNPKFGYFVTKNFCVGGEYSYTTQFVSGSQERINAFGPFMRYYVYLKSISLFIEGGFNYGTSILEKKDKISYSTMEAITFRPGFNVALGQKVNLEISFKYYINLGDLSIVSRGGLGYLIPIGLNLHF